MENKAKVIKVKGISIKLPSKAKLINAIDLDNYFGPEYSGKHNDICVVIKCPKSKFSYTVLIEDTGTPTLDDAERFHKTIDALKSNNIINRLMIIKSYTTLEA